MLAEPGTDGAVKWVRTDFDLPTHRMLRLVAAFAGLSITSYVRKLVEDNVKAEADARGLAWEVE